ncbi:MAG: hypothetical protein MJH10_09695 [Epibacterium sp.]|nr:hypothetical protein [Epibacterium sp.]NQX73808.1 hypothetical protein [Epibacterium sp.]
MSDPTYTKGVGTNLRVNNNGIQIGLIVELDTFDMWTFMPDTKVRYYGASILREIADKLDQMDTDREFEQC